MMMRDDVDTELQEGLKAYAHERMLAEGDLREKWILQWRTMYDRALVFLGVTEEGDSALSGPEIVRLDVADPMEDMDSCV